MNEMRVFYDVRIVENNRQSTLPRLKWNHKATLDMLKFCTKIKVNKPC